MYVVLLVELGVDMVLLSLETGDNWFQSTAATPIYRGRTKRYTVGFPHRQIHMRNDSS